jgi:predicted MFS family arabinose efflux permease
MSMYRGLPASVYWLALAKLLMMGGNFVYLFFALFLTKTAGLSEGTAGVYFAAATVIGLVGSLVGGFCADHFGRRRVLFASLLANGMLLLLAPLFANPMVGGIIAVVAIGIVGGAEPAINALLSDCTTPAQRKAAFSLLYMGANLGLALGSVAGGLLFRAGAHYIFLADGFLTALAAFTVFGIARTHVPGRTGSAASREIALGWVAAIRQHPRIPLFCLFFVAHAFVYSQTTFSFPLLLDRQFGLNGPVLYGSFMTANGIAVLVLTPLLTKLTHNIRPLPCVAIGIGLYVAGFGLYGVCGQLWFLALSLVLWSSGEVIATTNAKVFIGNASAPAHRGRWNSLLDMSFETGFGLGPAVAGRVIVAYGLAMVWPVMAAVAAVGSFGILMLGLRREPPAAGADETAALTGSRDSSSGPLPPG